MNRFRNILAIAVSLALLPGCVGTLPSARAIEEISTVTDITNDTSGTEAQDTESEVLNGQALVTLTLASGEDSPLLHEGYLTGDPRIRIQDVMNFGSAEELGETSEQKSKLSKETLYVAHVVSSAYNTTELLETLRRYSHVQAVSANYRVKKDALTDDPMLSEQWSLGGNHFYDATSSTPVTASIGYRPEASTTDESDIPVVAVVDDGIDFSHEDLAAKKWTDPDTGTCGYDAVNGDSDPTPTHPLDYHGTCVAGIIGATTNNGIGIAGVTDRVRLMAVKMFDESNEMNSGSIATELEAFEYIYHMMSRGVKVVAINCSFGMQPSTEPYMDYSNNLPALNAIITKLGAAGALFAFSAGNEATELTGKIYGANTELDDTYLFRVGSVSPDGILSEFSNYSKTKVHLMAPGETILTTTRADTFLPETYDASKRAQLCRIYETFDTTDVSRIRTYSDLYSDGGSALSIAYAKEDFHGNADSGSIRISLERNRKRSPYTYTFFYDITDYALSAKKKLYYSFTLREDGSRAGSWDHMSGSLQEADIVNIYTSGNHTYLGINLKKLIPDTAQLDGTLVYIDDLAISVENPDTRSFGRYDYISGTSFATPQVTGAIARLASLYPQDNSLTLKKKLLSCVRKMDTLTDSCIAGGILDMTSFADVADIHVDSLTYPVKKITLNRKSTSLKAGKKLKLKATVTPLYATDSRVGWKTSNKAWATVTQKGIVKAKKRGRGHTVTITATAKDKSGKKAKCRINIR